MRCSRALAADLLKRVFSAWWFYAAGAVFTAHFVTPAVHAWHVPRLLSGYVAVGMVSLLVAPYFNLWRYRRTTDWSFARGVVPWFYAVVGAVSVALTLWMLQ